MQKLKNIQRYANISDIPFDQRSLIHREAWFRGVTDKQTHKHTNIRTLRLIERIGLRADSLKIVKVYFGVRCFLTHWLTHTTQTAHTDQTAHCIMHTAQHTALNVWSMHGQGGLSGSQGRVGTALYCVYLPCTVLSGIVHLYIVLNWTAKKM